METKQFQLLTEEGEVKFSLDFNPLHPAIYEGVVNDEDSFVIQQYSRGYPTRLLNSWRCPRDGVIFNPESNIAILDDEKAHLVRYDIGHPKHSRLVEALKEKGLYLNPFRGPE